MAFLSSDRKCWSLAVAASALSCAVAIWPVASDPAIQSNALLFGLLPTYILLSTYLCLRLITWVDSKEIKLKKTLTLVLSIILVLGMSWIVFGRYFYLSTYGVQSVDQLSSDFAIRRALQVQKLMVALLSILCTRRSNIPDLLGSLLMTIVLAIFVFG